MGILKNLTPEEYDKIRVARVLRTLEENKGIIPYSLTDSYKRRQMAKIRKIRMDRANIVCMGGKSYGR